MNSFKAGLAIFVSVGVLAVASDVRMAPRRPNELSPEKQTSATIAGKQIRMEYSAPSARGRKVMGEVVPYGRCGGPERTAQLRW